MKFLFAALFWSALALLMYSHIVYPILMFWMARRGLKETILIGKLEYAALPTVVVLVAAFNEEKHIAPGCERIPVWYCWRMQPRFRNHRPEPSDRSPTPRVAAG